MFNLTMKKRKVVALLDIGSSSVGGSLVLMQGDNRVKVLYVVRKSIDMLKGFDKAQMLPLMLKTTEEVLSDLKKHTKDPIHHFFTSLASPWYSSTIQTIQIHQEKPFTVTHSIVDMLIASEVKNFKSLLGSRKETAGKLEVIDTYTVQVKLNGYETANPYDKVAKALDATLFISMGLKSTLDELEKRILHIFPGRDIVFNSFTIAAFAVIRDVFTDIHDFIFLDITGEVTEIALAKKNTLRKTATFPIGKNFFLRKIAEKLKTTPEEATRLLATARKQKNNIDDSGNLNIILKEAVDEWFDALSNSLDTFSDELALPRDVFFTVHPDLAPLFEEVLQKRKPENIMLVGSSFRVKFLNENLCGAFCDIPERLAKDPFLLLESMFRRKTLQAEHL